MLSATGIIISIDAYGPITDNAGGIAEMSGFDEKTRREVTDPLDAVGNTTKAVTKGYAIGSAVLAALTLFAAFKIEIDSVPAFAVVPIDNPLVLVGLIVGAMLPFFFTSYLMNSVGKAAYAIVEEVRKQFREHVGILNRTEKPDYGRAVDIVTKDTAGPAINPLVKVVNTVSVLFIAIMLNHYVIMGIASIF